MKSKTVIAIILIFIAGTGYFFFKGFSQKNPSPQTSPPSQTPTPNDSSAQIIKTIPDPLNETIIPADQIIVITFNKSLQNIPEFKIKFEPKIDFKVELSSDRKIATIKPAKPFGLGAEYTLSIAPDTKFDGVGNWGTDKSFHFRTIKYRGI
jgi:hypothetical protein